MSICKPILINDIKNNIDRFWGFVLKTDYCWIWTSTRTSNGYGRIKINGVNYRAHRVSYVLSFGEIEDRDLEIDHLCRNKLCVNPDHLELVTRKINTYRGFSITSTNSRKLECKNGHRLVPDNIYLKGNMRKCIACRRQIQVDRANKFKKAHRVDNPRSDELKSILQNGHTYTSIGLMFGVTDTSVRNWVKKHNLIEFYKHGQKNIAP